jgi:putative transposase
LAEKKRHLLAELTEEERACCMTRFRLLRLRIEESVSFGTISKESGVSVPTLKRWMRCYRESGLVGLARKVRSDRGGRRMREELCLLVGGLALQRPPRPISAIHRQVAEVARREGWRNPTYRNVLNVVRTLDPGLITLAHEGSKAYREIFDLVYCREATRPNEMWQADHCLLDIWLLDDKGNAVRPWLSAILDDFSRAVPGYYLGFGDPDVERTALMLRQGIGRKEDPRWHVCGIPDAFYTDNGSDYRSDHMEQVSVDIKMRLVFSIPGNPQGRGKIERFFQTVNQLFLCNLPGYMPKGQFPPGGASLSLKELEAHFINWLLNDYHNRAHGETGQPPRTRWESAAFLPRLPESAEALDLLLLTVAKTRRVRRDWIHFQGFRYMSTTLAGYVGEDVLIRYDPRDMAEIRIYHQNSFLCRAMCQELTGVTISLKEIIAARNRRKRELDKSLADRNKAIDLFLGVHKSEIPPEGPDEEPAPPEGTPKIKRYFNE